MVVVVEVDVMDLEAKVVDDEEKCEVVLFFEEAVYNFSVLTLEVKESIVDEEVVVVVVGVVVVVLNVVDEVDEVGVVGAEVNKLDLGEEDLSNIEANPDFS